MHLINLIMKYGLVSGVTLWRMRRQVRKMIEQFNELTN